MTNREILNLYREAHAFFELALIGNEYIGEKNYLEGSIPYIVNMSFACELYLKLILVNNGKSIKEIKNNSGHQLSKLYNLLLNQQKNYIKSRFKEPVVYDIEKELQEINTAFVCWRYLVLDKSIGENEKMVFKPYFILELNKILDSLCYKIVEEKNLNFINKIL